MHSILENGARGESTILTSALYKEQLSGVFRGINGILYLDKDGLFPFGIDSLAASIRYGEEFIYAFAVIEQ